MSSTKMDSQLPTFTRLGAEVPADTSPREVANSWFECFAGAVAQNDIAGVVGLFVEGAFWRDLLSLTFDFRSFNGLESIRKFLEDRLAMNEVSSLHLTESIPPTLATPYPDLAWIQASFEFETKIGHCSGLVRLVPVPGNQWKAYSIFTSLDGLKGYEENVGGRRERIPSRGRWTDQRKKEAEFNDSEPTVLIVGGGHNGLCLGARLKYLGVPTLIIDRAERVGDQWRGRYTALCTHDPCYYTHLPYFPFPPTWPVYTPAAKLGDWLESYAQHLELNVWTSCELKSASWDPEEKVWTVMVKRKDGTERIFKPRHIAYAGGWNGIPVIPTVTGSETFKGHVIHSSQYKNAQNFEGKKVVVIGAGVSAHDLAQDLAMNGVEVTMHQRHPTMVVSLAGIRKIVEASYRDDDALPIDIADNLSHSFPNEAIKLLSQRSYAAIAQDDDKEILAGLRKAGFLLYPGLENAGLYYLVLTRRGGYYIDVGACQLIIDGKIKLKSGTDIDCFTSEGIKFQDGSELQADTVIFATGYGPIKDNVRKVFGDELTDSLKEPWYLDDESELRAVWRDSGHEAFWYMLGNLSMSRFYSRRVALQIKAIEEGLFGPRYSIATDSLTHHK